MNPPPKVSIIIPVFNGANYLGQAIDSALAQSYQHIEVIVINDGSNDNEQTDTIALSYGSKIRYFQKENGGVASALNLGIQQMTGEFFSWLSHDDLYYPDKIKSQMELFQQADITNILLYCDHESIDEYGTVMQPVATEKKYIKNAILLILSTSLHGCSLLIPRAAFHKIGLFNETLRNTQDGEMWLRLAMAGYQFQHIPMVMVKGRIHRDQTTRTSMKRHAEEAKDFFLQALDTINIETLLANRKDILRILFKKKQLAAVRYFITILQNNGGLNGLYPVLAMGFLTLIKSNISYALNAIPGYSSMRYSIRKELTQHK